MLQDIKFWIAVIAIVIVVALGITVILQNNKIKNIENDLSTAVINLKAYESENDSLINKNIEYNYTVEQLNASTDSLVKELNNVRKTLKIKDKNIAELQYIASHNIKRDSIIIHEIDTIFREKDFNLDTTIGDKWAKLRLNLKYPNQINAEYSFNNETIVLSSSYKETIEPPHKCWLIRLFQKKHYVTEVEVIQQNPYCENDTHKHIKIVN